MNTHYFISEGGIYGAAPKFFKSQGFGSRKQCLQRIKFGTVSVAGQVLYDAKAQLDTTDLTFEVEGVPWLFRENIFGYE